MAKGRITSNKGGCRYGVQMFYEVGGQPASKSVDAWSMEYRPNIPVGSAVGLVQSAYNAESTDVVIGAASSENIATAHFLGARRWFYHEMILPAIMRHRPGYWFGSIKSITGKLASVAMESHGARYPSVYPHGQRIHECTAQYMNTSGFDHFEVGDRVVVFFHYGKDQTPVVIGFAQRPRIKIESEGSVLIRATRDTIHLFYGYGSESTVLGLDDKGNPETIAAWLLRNKRGKSESGHKPFAQRVQKYVTGADNNSRSSQFVSNNGLRGMWFSDTFGLHGPERGLVLVRGFSVPEEAMTPDDVQINGMESISPGKLLFVFAGDDGFGSKQPSTGKTYKRSDFIIAEYPGASPANEAEDARFLYKVTGFKYNSDSRGNIIQAEMTADMFRYPDGVPLEEINQLPVG